MRDVFERRDLNGMNFNHVQRDDNRHRAASSWWKNRTLMEKRLAIVTAITTSAMLGLLVALLVVHSDSAGTCMSLDCVISSAEVLAYVDETENPCDDFYQFACGTFLKSTNPDEDNKSTSTSHTMNNILINQIREMIEEPVNRADSLSLAKTKTFYRSCMNTSGIDTQGVKIIKDTLKEIGGWPMIDNNWREGDFDWKRATHKLRKIGYTFDLFLSIGVGVNKADVKKHIIEIMPPYSRRLDANDRYRDLHLGYVADIGMLLGAPRSRAERDAKDILEFEEGLRKVAKRSEDRDSHNNSYNPKTVPKLHYEFPSVPWFDYINGILWPGANISADEVIVVPDTVYIKELLNLLNKATKRVVANFIGWRFIDDFLEFLPKKFNQRKHKYYYLTRRQKYISKWSLCLQLAEDELPFFLKDLYTRQYITPETRRSIDDMLNLIRRKFDKQIDNFGWLDKDALGSVKVKIASLLRSIADYSDRAQDDEWVDQIYDEVEIRENKFISSLLELRRIKKTFEYRKLRQDVPPYKESDDSIYDIKSNKLTIPVDYLHGIYYGPRKPNYINYGALGTLIARDLSNMFLEGQFFDSAGNLREWFISENFYVYTNKTKCFENQFGRFYIPEIKKTINASLPRIEDVSEVAGLKYAYDAYSSWVDINGFEAALPGVRYNPKQLFWVASVMPRCTREMREIIEEILQHGNRTIVKVKINGALRNLPEFSDAFNCQIGSKMNPVEKCDMWWT